MIVYITNKATEPCVILSERKRVEESMHHRLCLKDIRCEDPSTTHLRCFAQEDTENRCLVLSTLNSNLRFFDDGDEAVVYLRYTGIIGGKIRMIWIAL